MMRIWYGFVAGMIWIFAMTGITVSGDVQVITTAIIIAGAMAGGD